MANDATTVAIQLTAHQTIAGHAWRLKRGAKCLAVLLDCELAEHNGLFKALAKIFGNVPLRYHGRMAG